MTFLASRKLRYGRDLLWVFLSRDLKVQYKRSFLGIAWSLLIPLTQLLIFGFLFKTVMNVGTPRYSAYAFTGLLMWSFFQTSLAQGTNAITENRELVRQPGFPVRLLPVTVLISTLYHTIIAFPILLVFLLLNHAPVGFIYLLVLPLLGLQSLLTLSLLYLLAPLNVVFRDVQHIVAVALQLLMFVNPVFWDASLLPERFHWVYAWNPLAHLLDAYRGVLLHGQNPDWVYLGLVGLGSAGVLVLTQRWFVGMSHRFAEEL